MILVLSKKKRQKGVLLSGKRSIADVFQRPIQTWDKNLFLLWIKLFQALSNWKNVSVEIEVAISLEKVFFAKFDTELNNDWLNSNKFSSD